ncbi:Hypp1853 [Branchiostoma lanceolatum]|uniref:Hypp1853 protein n=1 Tax=Branchiostoma lanceolatum TaxID=7740 RepID=A0A8J9ZL91_BRALA|nr:Hypp1853 [Branchiostoma lanceolatum]
MELRLFITAFLLVLVAFHVCAEDEKKEVERDVEKRMDAFMGKRQDRGGKRMDPAWLGKRMSDPSAFGKRMDAAWMGKRMSDPSAFGKRMDVGWMGKRDLPLEAEREAEKRMDAFMGKRLLDRGGKRMDAFMGKRDENRRGEEEELQKEMDDFFRRFGVRER